MSKHEQREDAVPAWVLDAAEALPSAAGHRVTNFHGATETKSCDGERHPPSRASLTAIDSNRWLQT